MSESLIKRSVAQQISDLAALAGVDCEDFAHRVYNSKVEFPSPATNTPILSIPAGNGAAIIITGIDIKTLYNTADAALPGDFRSTDDLNPYGPFVTDGGVGVIQILINGQQYCADMFDIGLINCEIILIVEAEKTLVVKANPHQPTGKDLTLVCRAIGFTVPQAAVETLKKKQTQFIDATP